MRTRRRCVCCVCCAISSRSSRSAFEKRDQGCSCRLRAGRLSARLSSRPHLHVETLTGANRLLTRASAHQTVHKRHYPSSSHASLTASQCSRHIPSRPPTVRPHTKCHRPRHLPRPAASHWTQCSTSLFPPPYNDHDCAACRSLHRNLAAWPMATIIGRPRPRMMTTRAHATLPFYPCQCAPST